MSCTGTLVFFSSVVCSVTCDKEATALVAVCMYISCAVLAAAQLVSFSKRITLAAVTQFTPWRLGRIKKKRQRHLHEYMCCLIMQSAPHVLVLT